MPKIKNWSRRKRIEDQQQVYVWYHDKKPVYAKVMRRGDQKYEVIVANNDTGLVLYSQPGFQTKEDARENAVNWLQNAY